MDTGVCQEMRDDLPLLVAGTLEEAKRRSLLDHLRVCDECRECFRREAALFGVAAADDKSNPLNDHPSADLLDRMARRSSAVSAEEASAIAQHLHDCDVCRQAFEIAQALPEKLSGIVSDEEIPLLAANDTVTPPGSERVVRSRPVSIAPISKWALAIAAALVLTIIWLVSRPTSLPAVAVSFAGQMRGESHPLIVSTPAAPSQLKAEVFVDPQPGHTYFWRVRRSEGSVTIGEGELEGFDQAGYGKFTLPVSPGNHLLEVLDITEADTLISTYDFSVEQIH